MEENETIAYNVDKQCLLSLCCPFFITIKVFLYSLFCSVNLFIFSYEVRVHVC